LKSELLQKISYDKAYRKNRLDAANWVLAHPETFKDLLEYSFVEDKVLAKKATWVLEFVCRDQLELLYPHLDYFFEQLPTAKGDGALRSVGLICELIAIQYYKIENKKVRNCLRQKHKEIMTECCFDWLITNQKVACQARAMLALYYLGTEIDWIHPELETILQKNIHQGSAGYKSRGSKILQKIARFRSKTVS
jgi:hypothetical protein